MINGLEHCVERERIRTFGLLDVMGFGRGVVGNGKHQRGSERTMELFPVVSDRKKWWIRGEIWQIEKVKGRGCVV